MTMNKLLGLLRDIGKDANLQREYEQDCEAVMARYGLDDEEKQALSTCDLDKIKSLTGASDVRMTKTTIESYD